jgi:hypothetical protein
VTCPDVGLECERAPKSAGNQSNGPAALCSCRVEGARVSVVCVCLCEPAPYVGRQRRRQPDKEGPKVFVFVRARVWTVRRRIAAAMRHDYSRRAGQYLAFITNERRRRWMFVRAVNLDRDG